MPYSQFLCAACGKYAEMPDSAISYVLGRQRRICAACKKVRGTYAKAFRTAEKKEKRHAKC